jgi:hypothetical protein
MEMPERIPGQLGHGWLIRLHLCIFTTFEHNLTRGTAWTCSGRLHRPKLWSCFHFDAPEASYHRRWRRMNSVRFEGVRLSSLGSWKPAVPRLLCVGHLNLALKRVVVYSYASSFSYRWQMTREITWPTWISHDYVRSSGPQRSLLHTADTSCLLSELW